MKGGIAYVISRRFGLGFQRVSSFISIILGIAATINSPPGFVGSTTGHIAEP